MPTNLKHHVRAVKNRMNVQSPRYEPGNLDNLPESLLITGTAIAAGVLMRRSLVSVWKAWRGADPPANPADPDVSWTDAMIWAAAVGTTVGVARVLGRRGSTALARRYFDA